MPRRKAHDVPTVGAKYSRAFKNVEYTMTVVRDGPRIGYMVGDRVYNSPSAAAESVTQNAVNGWRFWRMEE